MLAGLAVGVWDSLEELSTIWKLGHAYAPQIEPGEEEPRPAAVAQGCRAQPELGPMRE